MEHIRRITGTLRLGIVAAIVLLVVPAITALSFVLSRRITGRDLGPTGDPGFDHRPAGHRN